MPRPKKHITERIQITAYINHDDKEWLRKQGIGITEFVEQALEKLRKGEWEFER